MAVESLDIPLGTTLPAFDLSDPAGANHSSDSLMGPHGLLVIFTCNHCPYARAVWPRTISLSKEFSEQGINTVAINPNIHPAYPEDAPEVMKEKIDEWGIPFPYLIDESQETARLFNAQCTPDIYLFDKEKRLVYHGRVDDNWQDETAVTRHELREALENLVHGTPISERQFPAVGCSIKWRSS